MTLPMVADRRSELEKCVYCPKLCRASCPVSNAEPSESLTPWGKMSSVFFAGRGDVAIDPELAVLAWACTGCLACKERCDHKNPVADVLAEAREPLRRLGVAPPASLEVQRSREARGERRARALAELSASLEGVVRRGGVRLLLGCGYASDPRLAGLAARVASRLLGDAVELVSGCCGYPERAAGDASQAVASSEAILSAGPVVVLDPSCASTLLSQGPGQDVRLLIDVAAGHRAYQPVAMGPLRYHDPCSLGRGLRRFDEPRRVLESITGAAPLEFARNREAADCSGGGGLLPLTMPAVSEGIAQERLRQARGGLSDETDPGAPIVTACAGSGRRLRRSGAKVLDLVEILALGLGLSPS
jgi:dimethylglycine catabolism B